MRTEKMRESGNLTCTREGERGRKGENVAHTLSRSMSSIWQKFLKIPRDLLSKILIFFFKTKLTQEINISAEKVIKVLRKKSKHKVLDKLSKKSCRKIPF